MKQLSFFLMTNTMAIGHIEKSGLTGTTARWNNCIKYTIAL
jgi:hypothetical protein